MLKIKDIEEMSTKQRLLELGFKYVETDVSGVATSEEQSNKVFGIVYYPEENSNWEDLPDDRRISATQKIVIYCYGEYTPPTTEEQTTKQPTTEKPTTEPVVTENNDIIVDNDSDSSEDIIIE